MHKIAANEIPYKSCNTNVEKLVNAIIETLNSKGAMICEIHMHPLQTLFPKSASFMDKKTGEMTSALLEKMKPFMSEELQNECIYHD